MSDSTACAARGGDPVAFARIVRRLNASPEWEKVFDRGGVLVFKKERA